MTERGGAADLRAVGVAALVAGVALSALAWVPPMPLAGAQASDVIAATGVLFVVVAARRELVRVPKLPAAAFVAYALWVTIACAVSHGSWVRVAGTWWLVVLAFGVWAAVVVAPDADARIRRAVVVAALIGAITGLVGAALFYAGVKTELLNHAGDLVPGNYPRIRGTVMRANGLAALIGVGLLFVGELDKRWRKAVYAVLLLALAFTFSRTWIALAGTLAVAHFAFGDRRRDGLAIASAAVTVAVMLVVSWATVTFDPSHPWRLGFSTEPGSRFPLVQNALANIQAHPWFGIGPGRLAGNYRQAHCTILDVAALFGVPAAVAFLVGIAAAMRAAWKRARAGESASCALACVFILFAFESLAGDFEDQRTLWIGAALAFVSSRRSANP